MGALGVVHQGHGGPRQARQVVDLAGMIHSHLDHRRPLRLAQLEQGQRQADVVVQVADRRQYPAGITEMRTQDRRTHFLDRGLAIAAGLSLIHIFCARGTTGT